MAWMLQPKSFYQAMRPNFYTVAYRRSGAYKGMGSLGQDTSADTSSTTTLQTGGGYLGIPTMLGTDGTVVATNPFGLTPPTAAAQPVSAVPSWVVYAVLAGVGILVLRGGRR